MKALEDLISPQKTTFLAGRRINDNTSHMQEFLTGFNAKYTYRRAAIIKDNRKAFDTLRWDAIDISLEIWKHWEWTILSVS